MRETFNYLIRKWQMSLNMHKGLFVLDTYPLSRRYPYEKQNVNSSGRKKKQALSTWEKRRKVALKR